MSRVETSSVVSPKEMVATLQLPAVDVNSNPEIATIFEMLKWFRGDQLLVTSIASSVSVAASTTTRIAVIVPPNEQEEWEVLAIVVFDSAHIDTGDSIEVDLNNNSTFLPLQSFVGGGLAYIANDSTPGVGGNMWVYPSNFAGTAADTGSIDPKFFAPTVRKKNPTENDIFIAVYAKTTATVGTRLFIYNVLVRRRRLV